MVLRQTRKSLLRSGLMLAVIAVLGMYPTAGTACLSCQFDPPIMGPCQTQGECQTMCDDYYGVGVMNGVCSQGCCVCIA